MGAGHSAHLHVAGDSFLHRLPAHVKVIGLIGIVLAAVSVPTSHPLVLVGVLAGAIALLASTRAPWRFLLPRLSVEIPFALFAVVLPFVATGPRVDLGPVTVSEPGLVAAIALLLKGSIGVVCAVSFAVTTAPRDLVRALQHLKVPDPLVTIASFMVRYVDVVGGNLRRMKMARDARAFPARSISAWPVLAASTGALFIRSYERGERVHLAMVSRGYSGAMPVTAPLFARPLDWAIGLSPAVVVALVAVGVRVG